MIAKPKEYDNVQVNVDYEKLELGGHKGIIKKVEEYTGLSGNTSLKVEVDTAPDDKQPNYFQSQYDNNISTDKKWSTGGIKYVSLKEDESCVKMLKAFITSVENSNNGFVYDWNKDIDQLINKKVGLVFGQEEYQNDKGENKLATKVTNFRSYDKVDNAQIPKIKLLDGTYVDYDDYVKNHESSDNNNTDCVEILTDDLPF